MPRILTYALCSLLAVALCLSASTNQARIPPPSYDDPSAQISNDDIQVNVVPMKPQQPQQPQPSIQLPLQPQPRTSFEPLLPPVAPAATPSARTGAPGATGATATGATPTGATPTSTSGGPNNSQTELLVLSEALVDVLLAHKEHLVRAISIIFNTFLGNVALSIGRIAAVIFGIPLTAKQQTAQKRSDNIQMARSPQSGPMPSDAYGGGGNPDQSPFVVPILNRPLQYQDFQMMERLVVESIDVYNKWQKKSSNNPSPLTRQP